MRLLRSRLLFVAFQMNYVRNPRSNEVGDDNANARLELLCIEAVAGIADARRAITEGGIVALLVAEGGSEALLVRTQVLKTDISKAYLDGYSEGALIRLSASTLSQLHDSGPLELVSKELGLVGRHQEWDADLRLGSLMATFKTLRGANAEPLPFKVERDSTNPHGGGHRP